MKTFHFAVLFSAIFMFLGFETSKSVNIDQYRLMTPGKTESHARYLFASSVMPQEDTPILEKYWKLVTLNDRSVVSRDPRQSEPHMIFKRFKNELRGNGGCNSFTADYQLFGKDSITITPVKAGENSCKNLSTENRFFKFLAKAKKYEVVDDSLFMRDETGRLNATFTAVYLN